MHVQVPWVLVTGGAGFIGSALVRALVAKGHAVVNLDALKYAANLANVAEAAQYDRYQFVEMDIRDGGALYGVLREYQPVAIFHLAAETHVDRSIDAPAEFVSTNVVGTSVLLDVATAYWESLPREARDSFRFVHVSTDEVYGALGDEGFFKEASAYRPNSPYAASKAGADHLVRAYNKSYGLPAIITNCGNNYGPYQFPEKLIPLMILNALEGKRLPVYGKGDQVRDWIHVEDHVAALRQVAERGRPGDSYLIGASGTRTNLEVVTAICGILDRLAPEGRPYARLIQEVADRPGHDHRYAIDPTKVTTELGWTPVRSFEEGLEETVRWYMANRDWVDGAAQSYSRTRLGLRVRS